MSTPAYAGGCLCGAVRYLATGVPRNLCFCHCTSCRRAAGSPSVPWGTFERAGFRITTGRLSEYRSSARILRGFFDACGTALTFRNEARAAEIDVTLGSLDEPAPFAPQMHVWVADKLPWVHRASTAAPGGAGAP
jgi:hypothetical protein